MPEVRSGGQSENTDNCWAVGYSEVSVSMRKGVVSVLLLAELQA